MVDGSEAWFHGTVKRRSGKSGSEYDVLFDEDRATIRILLKPSKRPQVWDFEPNTEQFTNHLTNLQTRQNLLQVLQYYSVARGLVAVPVGTLFDHPYTQWQRVAVDNETAEALIGRAVIDRPVSLVRDNAAGWVVCGSEGSTPRRVQTRTAPVRTALTWRLCVAEAQTGTKTWCDFSAAPYFGYTEFE